MSISYIIPRLVFAVLALSGLLFFIQGYMLLPQLLSSQTGPSSQAQVVEIDMRIVAGQWRWDPDTITVPAGSFVRLTITNEDSQRHGFAIDELGVDYTLPGLQTTTVEFVATEPGEYDFFCSILCGAGHFGQRGTLVVTESDIVLAAAPGIPIETSDDLPIRSSEDAITTLPYELVDGVKEFHLTAEHIQWDYGDGKVVESWGYNGQLPGPEIRVTEGDDVRVVFTNNLPVPTTVHWHGIDVPNEADGVPGVTQEAVQPGESFVYEFSAVPPGTRMYHTHGSKPGDSAEQMNMGLAGPFIIEPHDYEVPDRELTVMLTERIQNALFAINGQIFPHIPSITVSEGDVVRIRMINAGASTFHPMHLHGHHFDVVAVDGNPVPPVAQLRRNTQPVLPGETYDIEFVADNPGTWLFHCHELLHAEGGMVMKVEYE